MLVLCGVQCVSGCPAPWTRMSFAHTLCTMLAVCGAAVRVRVSGSMDMRRLCAHNTLNACVTKISIKVCDTVKLKKKTV